MILTGIKFLLIKIQRFGVSEAEKIDSVIFNGMLIMFIVSLGYIIFQGEPI
jgi:hypothetical protein